MDRSKIAEQTAEFASLMQLAQELAQRRALLHKSGFVRGSPFPGRTYPTGTVTGMPRAV